VSAAFAGRRLLVDNSAFQRGRHDTVRAEWLGALEAGHLHRSPILEFEVLYSARNAREHAELREELEALTPLEISPTVIHAALQAQAELAQHAAGFHRIPHQDYIVAATAATNGLGVLHYDTDFERIAAHSSLTLDSVWIAPAGTLGEPSADPLRERRRALNLALAQFGGKRAAEILDQILDLLHQELRADGLQTPDTPKS
jgi:predicted nucleic acid-binding protein